MALLRSRRSSDKSDIYFARQQVGERLRVKENLPSGVNPEMGPIATGLGEVYMWTIRLDHRGDDKHVPGEPGYSRMAAISRQRVTD
jgi:cobalt-zinc-cadmium resistance protein CzcA